MTRIAAVETARVVKPRGLFAKLPFNEEAEASVLGGIILRNEVLAELPELETEAFHLLKHKVVWEAMRNLAHANRPIDVVTLENEIERAGKLDAIGGIAFLGELVLRVPTADNVVAYAADVDTHYRNRRAIVAVASTLERMQSWKHDPRELVSEAAGELQRIDAGRIEATPATRDLRLCPPLDAYLGDEEPTDDDAEDWIIRDLIPRGEPALWGGPMKSGKTWAAIDLMIAIARGESWLGRFQNTMGRPAKVLGILLEDSKRRLRKRLWELCRARGCSPNDNVLREHLSLTREAIRLPDDAKSFVKRVKPWNPSVIFVDNLTRVMVGDPNSTRDAAAFTKAWVQIGDELDATIIMLHHVKKPNAGDRNADPFDQIRGSSDFGAAARNIIVTRPLQVGEQLHAEVRMRGNLDLQRDGFVLGFERTQERGRWQAKLIDRGEIAVVKEEAKKQVKDVKETAKRAEVARDFEARKNRALEILHRDGACSARALAAELGLRSANTLRPVFDALVSAGIVRSDRGRGYVFVDQDEPHRQLEIDGGRAP